MKIKYLYRGHGAVFGIRRTIPDRPRFAWGLFAPHGLSYVAAFGWIVLLTKYEGPCWWGWFLRGPAIWRFIPLRAWCGWART